MGIGSIGSVSFWQQDQDFWNQAKAQSQASAASNALITDIGSLMTNQASGLASIANQTALDRVNAQLKAAAESAIQASQASSGTSSSSSSLSGAPAIGTGTVPLSANTSLLTLGIAPNSTFTLSDGTNTTSYVSQGTDTVADLINGLNQTGPTVAQATIWLNNSGKLVVSGKNVTDPISVGGTFASNIGFGAENDSFQPTAPAPKAANSSTPSTSSSSSSAASSTSSASSSTGSSTSTAANLSTATLFNSSSALQSGGTAESLLASSGLSGSLIDLLA